MNWDWRADLEVNSHRRGRWGGVVAFFLDPSFTFVVWLRFFLFLKGSKYKVVKFISTLIYLHVHRSFSIFVNYEIEKIGRALKIPHPHGIVFGRANIGDNVTILQNVTLGRKDVTIQTERMTSIGSGVTLLAGCVVLGPVDIGRNVVVGANAVVLSDLPDDVTAVGVPARVIRHS